MISWISLKVFFSRSQVEDLICDSTNDAVAPKRAAPSAWSFIFAAPRYFPLRTFRDNQIAERSTANPRFRPNFGEFMFFMPPESNRLPKLLLLSFKRNRTVKPPKRKLLMTLIMRVYAHTRTCIHMDYVLHLTYTNRWINFVQDTHRYPRGSRDWT